MKYGISNSVKSAFQQQGISVHTYTPALQKENVKQHTLYFQNVKRLAGKWKT